LHIYNMSVNGDMRRMLVSELDAYFGIADERNQ